MVESVTEISACNYWNVPQDFFTLDESEHLGEGAFGEVFFLFLFRFSLFCFMVLIVFLFR